MIDKIVSANAESKSLGKAQKLLQKLAELDVSAPLIEDYTSEIGRELHAHLQQQAAAHAAGKLQPQHAEPPSVATISVDGGRIMTRAAGVRGVHEQARTETKNACLQTMGSTTFEEDPQLQLPTCVQLPACVEKLVREMHAANSGGHSDWYVVAQPNREIQAFLRARERRLAIAIPATLAITILPMIAVAFFPISLGEAGTPWLELVVGLVFVIGMSIAFWELWGTHSCP